MKEGDDLYEIDARPYKAALDLVEASVAQLEAHQKRLEPDFRRASEPCARSIPGRHPRPLTQGRADHFRPHPGDQDIRFEPDWDAPAEVLASLREVFDHSTGR